MLNWMKAGVLVIAVAAAGPLWGSDLEILIDGARAPEYVHRGTTYIEAVRERDFTIRLTNPTPYRVAVALSVDGLNTLDAKHTDPWNAAKWVLGPYESTEIAGWQVSDQAARRFFFTGERQSYGAQIGKTQNLGIIEAVFFRERQPYRERELSSIEQRRRDAPAPPPRSQAPAAAEGGLSDEYAATGMGQSTEHSVEEVNIDLDRHPINSIAIRYEFRPQLVKLGVLSASPSRLERRERSHGFERYCPQPE